MNEDAARVLGAIAQAAEGASEPRTPAERLAKARADAGALRRFSGAPEPVAAVEMLWAEGPAGEPLPIRLYRPSLAPRLPVVVWMHGGGAIAGSLETHDPALRTLANRTGWAVAAVGYRLAPAAQFPAQHEDGLAALRHIAREAARLGLDGERLAVGGDSVGGLYATTIARLARDAGGLALRAQVLLYPNTDLRLDRRHRSLAENDGRIMTRESMRFEIESTVPDAAVRASSLASSLLADDLAGLPPALLVTCGFDPLRDEGEAYGAAMEAAGVAVTHLRHPGMIHAFLQTGGWTAGATEALLSEVAAFLAAARA